MNEKTILHRIITEIDGTTYSVGDIFYVDFMSDDSEKCIVLEAVSFREANETGIRWELYLMPVDRFKEMVINFIKEEL